MLFKQASEQDVSPKIQRLESYHLQHSSYVLWFILIGLTSFIVSANYLRIDEVAKASGEVIASSRVQVIQAIDGGVLSELNVWEGDRVKAGQILAKLDQTRAQAAVSEVEARLFALRSKAIRLRAEVTGARSLDFPVEFEKNSSDTVKVEKALFQQRRYGLRQDLSTLRTAVSLAKEHLDLVKELLQTGDVSRSEHLTSKRNLNEANAKLINRKNRFLEEVQTELTTVEDELSQNEQILKQRQEQLDSCLFIAQVPGIVKNIRMTTVGGVLRAGEEMMQIIPVDDQLIIEAKVSPSDIAQIRKGLESNIRFDPFDYTIHGGVTGKVTYVSADTLKEETAKGTEIYYRVHIVPDSNPVTTTTGKVLEVLPGMTTQVDIRTGDRTLMNFLLKPLRKTLSESFGER
ncbi:MAG: HlyD family efflux transporter periplasmic adaptor subunit [Gammaproteobacteria bacterium]|nr:HlyD family efflux transporter periplasmic adaptor subunit [Gammaproteobacteria bacterium]